MLGVEQFRSLIDNGPLISIDLILENDAGAVLLGKRTNRPAQGYWFVPGGRIRKNETLDAAFERITTNELNYSILRSSGRFLGVFEHFYADSVFGDERAGTNTHYVVLAYRVRITEMQLATLPSQQHAAYRWWSSTDAIASGEVHQNTKAYLPRLSYHELPIDTSNSEVAQIR